MNLTLGGAGADRAPADEIGNKLTDNRIQKFGCCRNLQVGNLNQKPAGDLQAFINGETAVNHGVINQPFPADHSAWLFKIYPHDHKKFIRIVQSQFAEALGIFDGSFGVVN